MSLATAISVLVVGMALSLGAAAYLRVNLVSNASNRFASSASNTNTAMTSTLRRYGDLSATTAAFLGTNTPADYPQNRAAFLGYVQMLRLGDRYPGTYGLGFMGRVPTTNGAALAAQMKAAGEPGFAFAPSPRPYACPIEYLQWLAPGEFPSNYATLDYCSINAIAAQMNQTITTGQQVVLAKATFPQGPGHTSDYATLTPAFGAGKPVATPEQRAQNLTGWVVGLFNGQTIAKMVAPTSGDVGIKLYTGAQAPGNLVVAQPTALPQGGETRGFHIAADGAWTLMVVNVHETPGMLGVIGPLGTLLGGVALSLALFGLVLMLRRAEGRARELANEATASLRDSEERFRSLAASSPAGIMQIDPIGTCLYANRRMGQILGRSPESLEGHLAVELIPVSEREGLLSSVGPALRAGEATSTEMRFQKPNGEDRWTRVRVASHKGTDGAILSYIVTVEDVTQLVESSARLEAMALHDSLTGLANRTLFLDRLRHGLARMRSRGTPLAVLFLDLDRFKVVNDSVGHRQGDELLVAVAKRFNSAMRGGDTLARFGGDEFTVLAEGVGSPDDAVRIAGRVSNTLREPFKLGGSETFVTASIGIVVVTNPTADPESVLSDADAAMYLAKERGRARYEIFNTGLRDDAMKRLRMEAALRRALDRHELRTFYQPQVDIHTQQLVGIEAVIRWEHPDRGLLAPAEFIDLAEDTGLIIPIGRWVLEDALHQFSWWRRTLPAGSRLNQLAVNLSSRQFSKVGLAADVSDALAAAAVEPSALCLEVTESILMNDAPYVVHAVQELTSLGAKLAIDDFGTGFSSLTRLKTLPVDVLKIDRSFIDGLGEDGEDEAIVEAVVKLGHRLGLTIVAEGVETPRQLEALQRQGAEQAQGFLWSRPLPPEEFPRWCEERKRKPPRRGRTPRSSAPA
jgi:diguanylate cyclase (GGDEF)-like protein/PAS domain S-box-containing protein